MPILDRRKLLEYWWVLPVAGTLGAFGAIAGYGGRVLLGKQRPGPEEFQDGPTVRVASLAALPEPYSAVEFTYEGTPCVLLRLPQAAEGSVSADDAHLVAFSRVCTHLGCNVHVLRDLEATALTYNYRPKYPVLGCPCHFSVFDPLRQGESVFGRALYPLPRVRLEVRDESVFATGIEAAPRPG